MIVHIEHLGIAVENAEKAKGTFEMLLDRKLDKSETVFSENLETHFFKIGQSQIELLESLNPDGVISRFIEKKGQGMHHLALKTDNILLEISRLKTLGFEFLSDSPKKGADNKLIIFLHPRSTEGVLIELCQDINP